MKRIVVVSIIAAAGLAGCMPVRGTGEAFMSENEIQAKDDATCRGYGAMPGSQPYVACRLSLRSNRSHEDTARRFY